VKPEGIHNRQPKLPVMQSTHSHFVSYVPLSSLSSHLRSAVTVSRVSVKSGGADLQEQLSAAGMRQQ
jgi:hypothetical protein